ncbi:MAG: hypothetical protein K2M53_07490 [Muribaculaceae bacterium]|nr:hypothetical protein [Muribaculaceae bacterium]
MKKLIYLAMSALSIVSAGMLTGCSADKYEMISENGRPDASLIDVTVTVDQETNRYTLHLNTPGYYPYWSVNTGSSVKTSAQNDFSGVIAEAGTYPVEVRIGNYNGLSEPKMYEIVIENSLAGDVFKGFDYNSEFNMWKNANVALGSTWFADGSWAELSPQPSVEVSNERIFLHTPAGMGGDQWQGQVHITTDIQVSSAETYDFSCFLNAETDSKVTVKVQKDGDDETFFTASQQAFKAGGSAFFFSDLEGFDGTLKIALDFGGNPDMDFEITNIVFKKHSDNDGTVLPPAVEFDDSRNLFTGFSVEKLTTWFADGGWSDAAIVQPTINVNAEGYNFIMPAGVGGDQWQGQVHMWTNVPTSSANSYDFCVTFTSSEDHPGITIKLQKGDSLGEDTDTDDNTFYCLERVAVKANTPYTYYFEDVSGIDIEKLQVCCDFAGGVAGSEITVSNLHLQVHQ